MRCAHCHREMKGIVQPPLLPNRPPLELFTCETPGCAMRWQTLSRDGHESLTSADIAAYGRAQRREQVVRA